jgi:hypothetical protein
MLGTAPAEPSRSVTVNRTCLPGLGVSLSAAFAPTQA